MHLITRMALAAAILAIASGPHTLTAQSVTTGTLTGKVTDEQSGVLPGTDVVAVHVPCV